MRAEADRPTLESEYEVNTREHLQCSLLSVVQKKLKSNAHRRRDATQLRWLCVRNLLLVRDKSRRVGTNLPTAKCSLHRVGGVNAPIGSCRELVANSIHTADADGGVYWALVCHVTCTPESPFLPIIFVFF